MANNGDERWIELCSLAVKETDPDKLLELTKEIDRILEERYSKRKGDKTYS